MKFSGNDQVLVTSLPSAFMEREASEVMRGRPTIATTILKVITFVIISDNYDWLHIYIVGHDHQTD